MTLSAIPSRKLWWFGAYKGVGSHDKMMNKCILLALNGMGGLLTNAYSNSIIIAL